MKRAILMLLVAAGCGGGSDATTGPDPLVFSGCDLEVDGVCVDLGTTTTTGLDRAGGSERFRWAMSRSLAFWGKDWATIRGWTVRFEQTMYLAPNSTLCGDVPLLAGCADPERMIITVALWNPPCFEMSYFVHEVGHAALRDYTHDDPRFAYRSSHDAGQAIAEADPACADYLSSPW